MLDTINIVGGLLLSTSLASAAYQAWTDGYTDLPWSTLILLVTGFSLMCGWALGSGNGLLFATNFLPSLVFSTVILKVKLLGDNQ